MTLCVTIYGFGSAFDDTGEPTDVDLLIIHQKNDNHSCRFAIQCKQELVRCLDRAHLTMLSASEEKHFGFLEAAKAIHLGTLSSDDLEGNLKGLMAEIRMHLKGQKFKVF